MNKYVAFNLIDYFDIWQDECGLYTVNDVMRYDNYIFIPENSSDTEIIKTLINKNYLTGKVDDYRIESTDDSFMEIFFNINDMPLCALEKGA